MDRLTIIVKSIDGGTGTFLLSLLNLKKITSNININILVLERPSFRIVKKHKINFLWRKNYYPEKYSLSLFNLFSFIKELLWIQKTVNQHNSNIVLSVDLRCNLLAIIAKILTGNKFKVIATDHIDLDGTIFDKSTPPANFLLKSTIKNLYEKVDCHVCVSKRLSSNLKKDFNLKKTITTIYNGKKLNFKKPKSFLKNKQKVIITIARLVKQKDHITLINAFRLLQNDLPNSKLLIASNGPEKARLKSYVSKNKLDKKIKFLGWVKDINHYLKKSDLFVLSSKREGFGYVLIEAMSQGLPVISTDTNYGPSEVLDKGKYGLLVPVGKPKKLKIAMMKILTNRKLYEHYSDAAVARSKYFSEEKMLEAYFKVIQQVVN